jgi:hypothetical protein
MLSLDFDIGPLLARIDGIEKSAKEAVRPAAFAASDAYYNEVKARALSIGGSKRLQASIYQKFVVNSASGALGDTATYHISWRKGRSTNNKKGQAGEGALPSTTFGHWIEFGRWQRYMTVTDKNGEWVTVARPEMAGKPKPKRGASQAEKDAYWMPRKGGPVFHGPKSFLRSGYDAKKTEAMQKAKDRMFQLVKESIK